MNDEDSSTRSGFVRQRRNLILISLVLLFAETSELTISKLNVFGNELAIHNPIIVTRALWVAFWYWLLRYYVYFHDIGDKGFIKSFGSQLTRLVERWAMNNFDSDNAWRTNRLRDAIEAIIRLESKRTREEPRGNETLRADLESWKYWDITGIGVQAGWHFLRIPVFGRVRQLSMKEGMKSVEQDALTPFLLGGITAITLSARAALRVLMRTRILSEYYVPYAIASGPLFYYVLH